jgi:hypothetical protein
MNTTADFIGAKIVKVRLMTKAEAELEGWDIDHDTPPVIVLDTGAIIYPSSDPEGNGPGMLFANNKAGEQFYLYPSKKNKEK